MQRLTTTTSLTTYALALSGCIGSSMATGQYDLFPPVGTGVTTPPLRSNSFLSEAAREQGVDVVIQSGGEGGCTVAAGDKLRERGEALLRRAIGRGFGDFPIDRVAYRASVVERFLSDASVCTALTGRTGATPENHDELRNHYKQSSMSEREAARRGMVARRIPVNVSCPTGYDWKASSVYNDVDDCGDVTAKIGPGVPTAVYALPIPPQDVHRFLTHPAAPALYSRYANRGPVMCDGYTDVVGDSFHALYVSPLWSDLHFIMRIWEGGNFSAWNMRRSCTINGEGYAYDDLMFNFGMRAYIPVSVDIDGEATQMTLVVTGVAAASSNLLAGLLPDDLPYERWIGGEFAKKLLLESWAQGWNAY